MLLSLSRPHPALAILTVFFLTTPAWAGKKSKEKRAEPQQAATSEATPEELRAATARELMALTGAGELGIQAMRQMLDTMRQNPQIPGEFIDKFIELAKPEDLVDLLIPVYTKNLDQETMDAAIAFYRTPEGMKLIAATPTITQESMAAGQQWGQELVLQVQAELTQP